jgi:RNA polymerase sigma factor (sigma-70 family)
VSLNDALGESRLADDLLASSFDVWWPSLEKQLAEIEQQTSGAEPPVRTDRELLEEMLNTVRAVARALDGVGVEHRLMTELRKDSVLRALDSLPRREAEVLKLRFGLEGEGPKTLQEIGNLLGVSRERVRQIEAQALARVAALRNVISEVGSDEES